MMPLFTIDTPARFIAAITMPPRYLMLLLQPFRAAFAPLSPLLAFRRFMLLIYAVDTLFRRRDIACCRCHAAADFAMPLHAAMPPLRCLRFCFR